MISPNDPHSLIGSPIVCLLYACFTNTCIGHRRCPHCRQPYLSKMSSLCDLQALPEVSSYSDWKELKHALDNWAVGSKFTYCVERKTPDKARYICRLAECPWRVNVSKKTDGMLELRVTQPQHTCFGAALAKCSSFSKKEWLDEAVPLHLLVTKTTKPKEVVETIKIHYAETISYKVAH